MEDIVAAEARGDESNLKGTDYHLLFAIWLLISGKAARVHFFEGNDLLARPVPPPKAEVIHGLEASIAAELEADRDNWIQLKCTTKAWTCSRLLGENLLQNFIFNSFLSEHRNRRWCAQLVTTSEIRQTEVIDFVQDPSLKPDLGKKLDQIVDSAIEKIADAWPGIAISRSEVLTRSLVLLRQIGECEPLPRRVIEAEVCREIMANCFDSDLADKTLKTLLGSLLNDTAKGADGAREYDLDWVERESGLCFSKAGILEKPIEEACDEQVGKKLSPTFSRQLYADRVPLRLLDEFVLSDSPVFVLTGRSGTGKTWLLSNWAQNASHRTRMLLAGHALSDSASLTSLVAGAFRSMASINADDHRLFSKVVHSSKKHGSLVVILDDVRPSQGHTEAFSRMLASVVEEARIFGIKLVLACQSNVARSLRLFADINPGDVFKPHRLMDDSDNSTDELASCVLDDFTSDELRDAIRRQVKPEEVDKLVAHLLQPCFSPFRNPYLLHTLVGDLVERSDGYLSRIGDFNVGALFDRRLQSLLETVSGVCRLPPVELHGILAAIANRLREANWSSPVAAMYQYIEGQFGSVGNDALDAFVTCGVLSRDAALEFSDARIGARLVSKELIDKQANRDDIVQRLTVDHDHDVAVHLICLASEPVALATALADFSSKWLPAAAEGLSLCNGPEAAVEAALVGFARRREFRGEAMASALGRYALRSRYAWKELVRRFLSTEEHEQLLAEHALWHVASMAPAETCKAIRLRFRLTKGPDNAFSQRREQAIYRRQLARAITPLSSINSQHAANHVLKLFNCVVSIIEAPLAHGDQDEKLAQILNDPLIREFGRSKLLATAHNDDGVFQSLLDDATSNDIIARAKATTGLEVVAHDFPKRVVRTIRESIRTESDARILEDVLWTAANVVRLDPSGILEAIDANSNVCWASYTSTATTLSILELIADNVPFRVLELLPTQWSKWPDEFYWLVRELVSICRYKCRDCFDGADTTPLALDATASRIGPVSAFDSLYAERAGVVDLLLSMGIDLDWDDSPLVWRVTSSSLGPGFYRLGVSEWSAAHEDELCSHALATRLRDQLVAVARAGHVPVNPLDQWRGNIRFWLVCDCLGVLVTLLKSDPTPEQIIATLPSPWEQLYVAGRLLKHGCASSELVDLAIKACEKSKNHIFSEASSERTRCLITLQQIVPERVPALRQERHGAGGFLGGQGAAGERLVAQIDEQPEKVVEYLEGSVETPSNTMFLENWHTTATKWSPILVSRSYSRMFQYRRISSAEASLLCELMLMGLEIAQDSNATTNHKLVYQAIADRLKGAHPTSLGIEILPGPINESHQLVDALMTVPANEITRQFLRDKMELGNGWWESDNRRWKPDGSLASGVGSGTEHHILVFQPAFRLALCALGRHCEWEDPAFDWTVERHEGTLVAKEVASLLRYGEVYATQLAKIQEAALSFPRHEQVAGVCGHALMMDGQLEAAKHYLEKSLAMPRCTGATRAQVLYNLACAFARLGQTKDCRYRLQESSALMRLDVSHTTQDPDLESVRRHWWFKRLIRSQERKERKSVGYLRSLLSKACEFVGKVKSRLE